MTKITNIVNIRVSRLELSSFDLTYDIVTLNLGILETLKMKNEERRGMAGGGGD